MTTTDGSRPNQLSLLDRLTTPAAKLTEEERTPVELKSIEPDLTVVVGGIDFFHYRQILCLWCPFIDTMLSRNMKEDQESKIQFPDKDPNQWLQVNKLLDPATSEKEQEVIIRSLLSTEEYPNQAIAWFDFLAMDSLVKKSDAVTANFLKEKYRKGEMPSYDDIWCKLKYLPCPLCHNVIKETAKHFMLKAAYSLSRIRHNALVKFAEGTMKQFLLDDACGDELWQFLRSKLEFPDSMLKQMDRQTIVNSDLFVHMLEVCGKDLDQNPSAIHLFPRENRLY